jgi:hypothetical protein
MPSPILPALVALAFTGQPAQAPAARITMVTVEGCAAGLLLKSARPATIDEAELIVSPTYRMKGTKAMKAEIKQLNGWLVRVRAELSDVPGASRPSTKVGGTTVSIGTGDDPMVPTVSRAPSPPELEVQSVTSLERKCTQ